MVPEKVDDGTFFAWPGATPDAYLRVVETTTNTSVNVPLHADITTFLGSWTDPMGNNVQVAQMQETGYILACFTDGFGERDTWKLRRAPCGQWSFGHCVRMPTVPLSSSLESPHAAHAIIAVPDLHGTESLLFWSDYSSDEEVENSSDAAEHTSKANDLPAWCHRDHWGILPSVDVIV